MYVIDRDDRELHPDTIEYCRDFFLTVNDIYHSRFRRPISVLRDGELLFNILWESEFYYLRKIPDPVNIMPYCANFDGRLLRESKETLDNTFIGMFDCLCFEAISEYSWHIIRYLNEFFPDKDIWVIDDAGGVFTDISYRRGRPDGIWGEKKSRAGCFKAGHRLPEEAGVYSVYSLMVSLTWARIRHTQPDAASDATALVINFADEHIGFGDMARISSAYVEAARRRGWLPFIRLDHNNQYSDFPGEDGWSKFFEQPCQTGDLLPEDCRTVIYLRENRSRDLFDSCNPYTVMYGIGKRCSFHLRLNERTRREAEGRIPAPIREGRRVFGALIRTTDYDMTDGVRTDVEEALRLCSEAFRESGCEFFFLAAEDQAVVDRAKEVFGPKLLTVAQRRVDSRLAGAEGYLSDTLNPLYESKYALGVDYLSVVVSLSGCERILYNRYAGALFLADALGEPLRRVRQVIDLSEFCQSGTK